MSEEKVVVNEPSQEWIAAAKKKHGQIFRVVIGGEVYVYRCLMRPEFRELQKKLVPDMTPQGPVIPSDQAFELEESIANKCVLWPEDFSKTECAAGLPTILATYVSDSSGASVDEAPIEL